VVFRHFHRIYPESIFLSSPVKHNVQVFRNPFLKDFLPVLRYPYRVILQICMASLVLVTPTLQLCKKKPYSRKRICLALRRAALPPPLAGWGVSSGGFYDRAFLDVKSS
jgi:hypothetical protein